MFICPMHACKFFSAYEMREATYILHMCHLVYTTGLCNATDKLSGLRACEAEG